MKRAIIFVLVLMAVMASVGSALAESVTIEDAVKLVKELNEKARKIPIGEEGWIFFQVRSRVAEKNEGYQLPYDHYSERWVHINAEGLADTEIWYYRTEKEGRKLISVGNSDFEYSYKDQREGSPMKPHEHVADFYFIGLLSELGEPFCQEVEIRVENVEYIGKKSILIENVCHLGSQFKVMVDDQNGWDVLGPYDRRWYDSETGDFLGSEHYWMMEDRTVDFSSSVSEVIERRVDRLPESVEKDLERTKNREFEKNGGGILNLETGNRSDSTPTSSRQTFIATGPTGSVGGVGYSTFIDVSIYQYMLNAAARSYTNQNVDRIGGNFLGLREYCRETIVWNSSFGGWANYGMNSSRQFGWASWHDSSCSWQNRGAGGAARFDFSHNGDVKTFDFETSRF